MIHPVDRYPTPDYPGVAREPLPLVRRRYGETVLERMRHGLMRPLVVFGLFASLSLPASGDDEEKDPAAQHEPGDREPGIRLLTPQEVATLVCGLEERAPEVALPVPGRIAGAMGFLSEEEGRALLAAFFAKNGFEIAQDVRIQDGAFDFAADGFDETRKVGFEFLGPREPGAHAFEPLETDLPAEAVAELDLDRTRSDRAILVLDGRNYSYNVSYMNHLPSKARAVETLLEDVRRFFVWLDEEGRLRPTGCAEEGR